MGPRKTPLLWGLPAANFIVWNFEPLRFVTFTGCVAGGCILAFSKFKLYSKDVKQCPQIYSVLIQY